MKQLKVKFFKKEPDEILFNGYYENFEKNLNFDQTIIDEVAKNYQSDIDLVKDTIYLTVYTIKFKNYQSFTAFKKNPWEIVPTIVTLTNHYSRCSISWLKEKQPDGTFKVTFVCLFIDETELSTRQYNAKTDEEKYIDCINNFTFRFRFLVRFPTDEPFIQNINNINDLEHNSLTKETHLKYFGENVFNLQSNKEKTYAWIFEDTAFCICHKDKLSVFSFFDKEPEVLGTEENYVLLKYTNISEDERMMISVKFG